MNFHASIKVDSSRTTLSCPQINLMQDLATLVACHVVTNKIVVIGMTKQEMISEAPDKWYSLQNDIEFTNPFDIQQFNVRFVVAVLCYYAMLIRVLAEERETNALGFFHRFNYAIDIEGYEKLPEGTKSLLENSLLIHIGAGNSLSLNGRPVKKALLFYVSKFDWLIEILYIILIFYIAGQFLKLLPILGLGIFTISLLIITLLSVVGLFIVVPRINSAKQWQS